MTIPAARVLAFPGIDLETLAKLRARVCDAFLREDLTAYKDACMMIRKLIGGQDVSETGARNYRCRDKGRRRGPLPHGLREPRSAKSVTEPGSAGDRSRRAMPTVPPIGGPGA